MPTVTYIYIACFLLVLLYFIQVIRLLPQIEEVRKQRLWSAGWLWVAFIPFLGTYIFNQTCDSTLGTNNFNLTPKRSSTINPAVYVDSRWALFQEQYDRKTSAHHGTQLRFLDPNLNYDLIATSTEPVSRKNTLFIEVARKPSSDVLWGSLSSHRPNWMLKNHKTNVVFPIIDNPTATKYIVRSCQPAQSHILYGGERFIVGLSEFHLILLPMLYLIWNEDGEQKHKPLDTEVITWNLSKSSKSNQQGPSKTYWEIRARIFTAFDLVEYIRVVSGISIKLNRGQQIAIMPGDKFSIPRTKFKFLFDYRTN